MLKLMFYFKLIVRYVTNIYVQRRMSKCVSCKTVLKMDLTIKLWSEISIYSLKATILEICNVFVFNYVCQN